jgi:hypothetical protein
MFTEQIWEELSERVATKVAQKILEHQSPKVERIMDKQEVLNAWKMEAEKGFTKVSPSTLYNWEDEGLIVNIGTSYRRKYHEKEILYAMTQKGRKRRD